MRFKRSKQLGSVLRRRKRVGSPQMRNTKANSRSSDRRDQQRVNRKVLQRQTDLAVAEGTEVRALTDYNKALADLQRVTGMTLITNNLQVSSADNSGKK